MIEFLNRDEEAEGIEEAFDFKEEVNESVMSLTIFISRLPQAYGSVRFSILHPRRVVCVIQLMVRYL
jgi:hypothetical protein